MAPKYAAFSIALGVVFGSGLAFYPVRWLPRRARAVALCIALGVVLSVPAIVPAHPLRLLANVAAIFMAFRVYDHFRNTGAPCAPGLRLYAASMPLPFALVLRRVASEPVPPRRKDWAQAIVCSMCGAAALALVFLAFEVDWRRHSFVAEHCAKAISFFLFIQFMPNALAAAARLTGLPATNFAGPFFLARTPAEFWRTYNRPAGQFFQEYVFKPAGGRMHPVRATLVTFLVSGVIHEYVFDLAAGRVLGSQMLFFAVQGLAVVATLRFRPRGVRAVPMILLTIAFNLATVRIFLSSLNAVVPFYVPR